MAIVLLSSDPENRFRDRTPIAVGGDKGGDVQHSLFFNRLEAGVGGLSVAFLFIRLISPGTVP